MARLLRGASALGADQDGRISPRPIPQPSDDRYPLRSAANPRHFCDEVEEPLVDQHWQVDQQWQSQIDMLPYPAEPCRNMFWETLHARILGVLQELQAQEGEKPRASVSEPLKTPSVFSMESVADDLEQKQSTFMQRVEEQLADNFKKMEHFVLKQDEFNTQMQVFSKLHLPHLPHFPMPNTDEDTHNKAFVFTNRGDSFLDPNIQTYQSARAETEQVLMQALRTEVDEHLTKTKSGVLQKKAKEYIRNASTHHSIQKDGWMARFVESFTFTAVCSTLILVNAVFIGFQSQISFQEAKKIPAGSDPTWFAIGNRAFFCVFMIELFVRLIALRVDFFVGPLWQWNVFDFLLVLSSVAEEVFDSFNLAFFRTLRVLRMVRTLRIIRVFRFFRELRLMASAILHTLSSLGWALILLLLIMYLFSVVFMQAAITYMRGPHDSAVRLELIQWFNTVGTSMSSLFRGISGGQDWFELQHPLGEISVVYSGLLSAYIFFVVFGVLNVLVSVFVERASESSKLDRDLATQAEETEQATFTCEMHDVFQEIDVDGTGHISQQQFEDYLKCNKVKAFFKTRNLEAAAFRLFTFQTNNDETLLDKHEFIIRMLRLRGDAKAAEIHVLLQSSRERFETLKSLLDRFDRKLNHVLHFQSQLTQGNNLSRQTSPSSESEGNCVVESVGALQEAP